jgi:hypothetical protein
MPAFSWRSVRVCSKCITLILVIFLPLGSSFGGPLPRNSEPGKGLGMWVWSSSSFLTEGARQQMIRFCLKNRITHLDVQIKMTNKGLGPVLKDGAALRELISLAGQHNITIAALRGNPKMFFSENHERTLAELKAIVAFSKAMPQERSLRGIKYDVEPYCTKEWKAGTSPLSPMMVDYLVFLRKARFLLDQEAPQLWLAADIPFWWDKDRFVLEFEGKRKRFSEHIQDITDYVTIMSYRRSPQKILDCVEDERRYARQINKVIYPSLETVQLFQDPQVSFWGVPNEEFWKVISELGERTKGVPEIGGIMVHCYRTLYEKLNSGPPYEAGAPILQ